MSLNPSDIEYSVIPEVTEGVTPPTGALLKLPHVGGTSLSFVADALESNLITTKRGSAGSSKTNWRVEGGLQTQLFDSEVIDLLFRSAVSGTWAEAGAAGEAGDILKAGNTDQSLTIQKKIASLLYHFKGCQVSKMTLAAEVSGNADLSFEFLGMDRTNPANSGSLTTTEAADGVKYSGRHVTDVTVTGLTGLQYRKLELSVEQTREAKDAFGSDKAVGIGTAGNRKVTLSLTFYRQANFNPETVLLSDEGVLVSFKIGAYTFTLPAAIASIPQDEEEGAKYLVRVDFTAKRDNDLDTDFMITRA